MEMILVQKRSSPYRVVNDVSWDFCGRVGSGSANGAMPERELFNEKDFVARPHRDIV